MTVDSTATNADTPEPGRLGFAVKVLGRAGLKSNDSRRWQSGPHLRVSIGYLHAIFEYLEAAEIRMYRISSDVAPYLTHPELPQFHRQIEESEAELALLGEHARRLDLRLSMHPSQYIVLNSPDERIARSAVADFVYHARFLDALGVGPEAKIVTHVGGRYGDKPAAMARFVERYAALPNEVQRRLVLENDAVSYSVAGILAIHRQSGIPLVFDILHHRVNNPGGLSPEEACRACLATWPAGETAKIHYSSQRTVARTQRKGADPAAPAAAKAGEHDDWIDPDDFLDFARAMDGCRFDVMLEAKQKDLALLRLRTAIDAAGWAGRFW